MIENAMLLPEPNCWLPPANAVLVDLSDLEPDIKDLNQKLLVKFRKEHGYTDKHIEELVKAVRGQFDFVSLEEASDMYNKSPY